MYTYKATVTNVVDGDTFDAIVDVGFSTKMHHRFRLYDVDTPETWRPVSDAEYRHGMKAYKKVKELIENKEIKLITYKLGVYGRYSASVILEDGSDLKNILIENNLIKLDSYPND